MPAPYEFSPYHNPQADQTIASLLQDQGRIQADATRASGNAWAGAIQNIGQTVAQIPQQLQQRQQQQVQQQTAEQQLAEQTRAMKAREALSSVMQTTPKLSEDGVSVWDVGAISKGMTDRGFGPEGASAAQHINAVNDAFRQARAAQLAVVKTGAQAVIAAGNDPTLANHFIDQLETNKLYPPDQIKAFRDFIKQDPANVEKITAYLAGPQKMENAPAGSMARSPLTGQVIPGSMVPEKPTAPTKASLALQAAGGDPNKALGLMNTAPASGAAEDARYEQIQQALTLKQPVSPTDVAWASAYEKRKTIGPEASAAAASNRQAIALAAQTAQQARAQRFTESQAGRKELTEKVEQPYLDSLEKAETLRTVIDAAKNGNMEAASVQSLLATLGLVTSEGIKRINNTELQNVAGAGNVLERIKSQVGGLTTGQKLSTKLQSDLLELSALLQQSAYKKYTTGHKSTTQRYQLTDEPLLPQPETPTATAPPAGQGINPFRR